MNILPRKKREEIQPFFEISNELPQRNVGSIPIISFIPPTHRIQNELGESTRAYLHISRKNV